MKNILLAVVMLAMALGSCRRKETPPVPDQPESPSVSVPVFNSDSAYAFMAAQTAFGPRVPGSKAHEACALWMESQLKRYCDNVTVQPFVARSWDKRLLNGKNIIASFNPDARKRILLCAHWDSRPYADHDPNPANHRKPIDGANDGASGVGALIEVARLLSQNPLQHGVDIIFFDLEDLGEPQQEQSDLSDTWCLGSQHWSKTPHITGYRAAFGILLDMVGAPDATFFMEGTSMHYAPEIMQKVWNTAHQIGYGNYFIKTESNPITDDHLYINKLAGIPTIDIIHIDPSTPTGFFKYWHTVNDRLENIDKNTLKAVGQTVTQVIYSY
ncbi:MAG TPA: M28 family peptidase [Bacteroidales bacterium]|nr:M28 family peptidase [Bacteroidales bacterium]HRZ48249.1 M28 family peptidase [Bacteroidales bacterium]